MSSPDFVNKIPTPSGFFVTAILAQCTPLLSANWMNHPVNTVPETDELDNPYFVFGEVWSQGEERGGTEFILRFRRSMRTSHAPNSLE